MLIIHTETCHYGQVVAVSAVIPVPVICAHRLHSAIRLVAFQQELCVVDAAVFQYLRHAAACKYMVNSAPFAFVFVCPLGSIASLCRGGYVEKATAANLSETFVCALVVEIARHYDLCLGIQAVYRVRCLTESLCHLQPVPLRNFLSAIAARRMHHKHMKRVTASYKPLDI